MRKTSRIRKRDWKGGIVIVRSRRLRRSRRDSVRRRRAEGGLEDRKKARCRLISWKGDYITKRLQAGGEEEKNA